MTSYVILQAKTLSGTGGTNDGWEQIGTVSARSAKAAIRERLDGAAQSSEYKGEGEYVAVPERSWRPTTVKLETKTALKFS